MLYKRYVDVITLIDKQGRLTPLILRWENGVQYPIDRILEIRKAVSEVGGCGILYRCRRKESFFMKKIAGSLKAPSLESCVSHNVSSVLIY